MSIERFLLPGSERLLRPGAQPAGVPNPADIIDVSVVLRRRTALDLSQQKEPMTRDAFAARHGASLDDVQRVEAFDVEMDNSSSELIDYFLKRRDVRRS